MLLREYRVLENIQILCEDKVEGTMKIRSLFQRADEENLNGRIYSKKILTDSVKALQPMIKGNRLFGELDHPPSEIVRLSNASHMITKLEMKGNDVMGEFTLMSTPAGQVAQQIIKSGGQLGISSRGTGSVKEVSEGKTEVQSDYKWITSDLVADPSVADCLPVLAEGKNPEIIRKAISQVYGERVFLTLLENKLKGYGVLDADNIESPLDDVAPKIAKSTKGKKKGYNKKLAHTPDDNKEEDEEIVEGSRGHEALIRKRKFDLSKSYGFNKPLKKGRASKSPPSNPSEFKSRYKSAVRKALREPSMKEGLSEEHMDMITRIHRHRQEKKRLANPRPPIKPKSTSDKKPLGKNIRHARQPKPGADRRGRGTSDLSPAVQSKVNKLVKSGQIKGQSGKPPLVKKAKEKVEEGSRGHEALIRKRKFDLSKSYGFNKPLKKGRASKSSPSNPSEFKSRYKSAVRKALREPSMKEAIQRVIEGKFKDKGKKSNHYSLDQKDKSLKKSKVKVPAIKNPFNPQTKDIAKDKSKN